MSSLISQKENFSGWYNQIVQLADLVENSTVRGCLVLKPYGFAIWENIQSILDKELKKTGHSNVYFPLFIPKSYFSKEASHVDGFAKECAVVTHYRLKSENGNIIADDEAKLTEELIVRPTSETVIWSAFKNWIKSYRSLPIKINQWANVCRWEMRTRPFLRTSEFLWQEGHTAHTSKEEAKEEVLQMLDIYYNFGKEYLSIPFIKGRKTENEKFAGAEETFTIEALMKDGKALQCGTSHLLGQNFSKAFDVKFLNKGNKLEYVWGTSWGISTRLIGALIMTHGDDNGLVLPPKIAPIQVVIILINNSKNENEYIKHLVNNLEENEIKYKIDDREEFRPGYKFNEWEIKGVPIRICIGEKDIENKTLEITRRDTGEKFNVGINDAFENIKTLLEKIQENLFNKSLEFRNKHTFNVKNYEEFKTRIKNKDGLLVYDYDIENELKIKEETGATVRCFYINDDGKITDESKAIYAQNY